MDVALRLKPVTELGWVDLDFGRGPAGTPSGRLTASVGPEVVGALAHAKVDNRWLAYSLPYGAVLDRTGQASTVPRQGWQLSSSVPEVPGQPLSNMIDGNRGTRWSSGAG